VKRTGVKFLLPLFLFTLASHASAQALDGLLSSPGLWQSPRQGFAEQHRDLGFYWLSDTKDRAETHAKGLTLFGRPVYEVDAAFDAAKLSGLTISIYNRGDAGNMGPDQWKQLITDTVASVSALTRAQPAIQGQEASDAVKAYAINWQTPAAEYLLEYSRTKENKALNIPFRAEFARLQITPASRPKSFMEQALAQDAPDTTFNGLAHVKHDTNGDVRIETVPMVDQGEKGYCVVATAERVMRYYGVRVDENELAELANTSASAGTSNEAMFDSLKKLSQRLRVHIRTIQNMDVQQILDLMRDYNMRARTKRLPEIPDQGEMLDVQHIYSLMKPDLLKDVRTHNKAGVDRFQQQVRDNINQGIPVLWSVMLGIVPELNAPQTLGGHMRLIIGYNDQTNEILYTDSWGPGHELKRMPADNAWTITTGMNTIEPL